MVPMMTLVDLMDRLRSVGIPISQKTAKQLIEKGVFGTNCCVLTGKTRDLVFLPRKAVEDWIEKYEMPDLEYEHMKEFYGSEDSA